MYFANLTQFWRCQKFGVGVIIGCGIGLLCPTIAIAQAISVVPVTIQMIPGQMATSLSVTNQGTSEMALQVRIYAWAQVDGIDKLSDSNNVLASPPLATIPPGGTQVVRLILRRPPYEQEATYRILLDQIPPPAASGTVRIALRLSIPIFAEPATRTAAHLLFRIERLSSEATLVVTNNGNRHELLRDIVVATTNGHTLKIKQSGLSYVLAGQSQRWTLVSSGLLPTVDMSAHLTAIAESGVVDQTIHISAAP